MSNKRKVLLSFDPELYRKIKTLAIYDKVKIIEKIESILSKDIEKEFKEKLGENGYRS